MRVAITIQRPPHVHFYRPIVAALEDAGHETAVFTRDTEINTALLDAFDVEYTLLSGAGDGLLSGAGNGLLARATNGSASVVGTAAKQATYEGRLIRRLRSFEPDVVTGIGGVSASHAAAAVGARSVVFTDTEHARLSNALMSPFADAIYTPDCFHSAFGERHVRYPSYHELAYLHPNRFEPDPDVRSEANVDPDEPLAVVRLTGWDAVHDVGAAGMDDASDVIERLEAAGAQVRLTSEIPLSSDLSDRRLELPPERIHHLLASADLYLGEGATMAAESAVLGTPALYVNTLRMGYTDELEARYGLLYNFQGAFRHEHAVKTAERLLDDREANRPAFRDRRERLLAEKTDPKETVAGAIGTEGVE